MPDSADHPKPKVQAVEEAIQLALAFRWEDALQLNQELLERFGPDEDSYNRLGKALMELGRREEAMAAYQSTIEVNPLNQIAARQLTKLGDLSATKGKVARVSASLDSAFFIEEPGKTALTRVVPDEELGKVQFAPGDPVELSYSPAHVTVRTLRGETLGTLEPRMAQRLRRMVDSGVARLIHTDVARDGMLAGPGLAGLSELTTLGVPVMVAGGVSSYQDLKQIREGGAEAAIVGRALLDGTITLPAAIAAAGGVASAPAEA